MKKLITFLFLLYCTSAFTQYKDSLLASLQTAHTPEEKYSTLGHLFWHNVQMGQTDTMRIITVR